jgi:2-dehydro-3-deoxygalactonokinase
MAEPALVAVDWGTSRLRAALLDSDGQVLARSAADEGIMHVKEGRWAETLDRHVGAWLRQKPTMKVVMAGMIGSRNGWVEAPYAECPADWSEIAARMTLVRRTDGGEVWIAPGLFTRNPDGIPDVMRGEETLIAGTHVGDGVMITLGTHCKWATLKDGRVETFASFMTGEFFAALKDHTILGRLAENPEDNAGFVRGLTAAKRKGGLLHTAFQTRTSVLLGDMPGAQVDPFLSGLLIGSEILGGLELTKPDGTLHLLASGPRGELYRQTLAAHGYKVIIHDPENALIAGLARLMHLRGLD